jgi:hypothetical protein
MPGSGNIPSLSSPIFILGCHKSGTSLLRSLLDGHGELVVFPREVHFFHHAGAWIDYPLRGALPVERDKAAFMASVVKRMEGARRNIDPYADSPSSIRYDIERFTSCFGAFEPKTLTELYEAFAASLYYSLFGGHLSNGARIVDKSVENSEYAATLRWMFPDCSFIHIVRNPYATIVAIRRSRGRKGYPEMDKAARSLYNSSYQLFKNRMYLDRYLVLRYEDLVNNTRAVMSQVSDFLHIRFIDDLLAPSVLSTPWQGNSTSNTPFSGVSDLPLAAWKEKIYDFEIHLVNRIAGPVLQEYGYEKMVPQRSSHRRVKGETLLTYIKNRVLLSSLIRA